jgi:CRISPR-associated protein (TIGR03984 family)
MNAAATKSEIQCAMLLSLDSEHAKTWLEWFTGSESVPQDTFDVRFALSHCDSGVTWGYLDDQGVWRLGSTVDPELCPIPTASSLHELRLFGSTTEALIWRRDDGQLQGRVLADSGTTFSKTDPLYPIEEDRRLRGKPGEAHNGFTRYTDPGGAQHLAPTSFPLVFSVRHYLEQDPYTGAVRIAVTRLVPRNAKEMTL